MPYASNGELPPQVRGALDPHDQDVWREAFNHALEEYHDERTAFRVAWHAASKGENVRAVSGIVSRDVVDSQGERINQDELVKAFNDAVWYGGATINDVHTNHPFGVWFDAQRETDADGTPITRTYGVVYKNNPFADACWKEQILTGNKNGLSVGIMKLDPYTKCEGGRCWRQIDKMQVFEGSAVPKGSCPGTVVDRINFSAKAAEAAMSKDDKMSDKQEGEAIDPARKCDKCAKANKSDMVGPPPGGPQPDAVRKGTSEEAIMQIMGMLGETNVRLDRIEAGLAMKQGVPPASPGPEEKAAAPQPSPAEVEEEKRETPETQAAEEATGQEVHDDKPAEGPSSEGNEKEPKEDETTSEKDASNKGSSTEIPDKPTPKEALTKGAPAPKEESGKVLEQKNEMGNKAAEMVAANKAARKEAEAKGAAAERPELQADGADKIADRKPDQGKTWDEKFAHLAHIANREGTKGLEREAERMIKQ